MTSTTGLLLLEVIASSPDPRRPTLVAVGQARRESIELVGWLTIVRAGECYLS